MIFIVNADNATVQYGDPHFRPREILNLTVIAVIKHNAAII